MGREDVGTAHPPGSLEEEDWDFWSDEAKLHCVGYHSQIDMDLYAVLSGVVDGRFCSDMAEAFGLPEQYVELLQSILCSAGWCEYGTSPRGCFIDTSKHSPTELEAKLEAWIRRKWGDKVFAGDDPSEAEPRGNQ